MRREGANTTRNVDATEGGTQLPGRDVRAAGPSTTSHHILVRRFKGLTENAALSLDVNPAPETAGIAAWRRRPILAAGRRAANSADASIADVSGQR